MFNFEVQVISIQILFDIIIISFLNYRIDNLVARMERNEFDLIAVGRALLQDAQWANKIREGRSDELMEFTKDALATLE